MASKCPVYRRFPLFCLLCAIGLSAPVRAAAVPAEAPRIVLGGAGQRIEGSATVRIHAPREAVFAVLGSCAEALKIVPGLETCEVRERAADGAWSRVWQVMEYAPFLPRVRVEVMVKYAAPVTVSFERIAGDPASLRGTWTLDSDGEYTVAHYSFLFEPAYWLPQWILRAVIRRDLPRMLESLRSAAESHGAANLG
jgi:hypothetical protein